MPMTKKKKSLKRAKMRSYKTDKRKKTPDEVSNDTYNSDKNESETPSTPKKLHNYDLGSHATPIRRRRVNRENSIPNKSLNITNLNILFDSEFIYNAHSGNDVFVNKSNSPRKRSLSSISKFSSPIQGEPYRKHQFTQTPEKNPPVLSRYNANEETPKRSKMFHSLETENTIEKALPLIKNKLMSKQQFKNEVNINPYLKNIEAANKEDSYAEASFFHPNLFQQYSSTPIQAVANHKDLVENLAESIFSPKTPTYHTNVNLNKTPKNKILKKDSIKGLRNHTLNNSVKRKVRNTPISNSKLDISKESSMAVSFNNTETGCCENLFSWLKKYCKLTHQWTGRIVNVCLHLGLQLKNTLSSLYAAQNNSLQGSVRLSCNRCKEYQEEVTKLSLKLIEMDNFNKANVDQLNKEIQKIKEEFSQFMSIKSEVESLKEELKSMTNLKSVSCAIPPPPPPPLPLPPLAPPPPPPPPPPPLMAFNSNKLTISKKKGNNGDDKENKRPVISLEDILKVKLKKTSHSSKPYQPTPTSHHSNQPTVSLDMLRQIKLRPSSRGSRSVSIPENESMDVTLSPNSNLCKLLKTEISSGRRLKRLRKIGGLSYDSVYRRKFGDGREREFDQS